MRTREEKMASWRKPYSSSVSGSNRLVRLQTWKKAMSWCTAQWKMPLFCAKTIVKESRKFELARLKKKKKKKKEKHCGRLVTFWFDTVAMLFSATWCVVRHENSRRWTVGCYNGLQVSCSCFGDFEEFVCISIYCVSALSLHIESTDSMIPTLWWVSLNVDITWENQPINYRTTKGS